MRSLRSPRWVQGSVSGRAVLVAAGRAEWVPSDCMQLVVRGTDDADLARSVLSLIGRPPIALPPSGTARRGRTAETPSNACCRRASAWRPCAPFRGAWLWEDHVARPVADELGYRAAWVSLEADWSVAELIERLVAAIGQHIPAFGWTSLLKVRRSRQFARRQRKYCRSSSHAVQNRAADSKLPKPSIE